MNIAKYVGMALVCGAALGVTGCHKHSIVVGAGGNVEAEPAYKKWESHWFFGTIGETEMDVAEVCPSGNATVKDKISFLNGLVAAFTGIVWSPSTVIVYCDDGGAAAGGDAEEEASEAVEEMDDVDEMDAEADEEMEEDAMLEIELTPAQLRQIARHPDTMAWARGVSRVKAAELAAAMAEYESRTANVASAGAPKRF